MTDLPTRLHNRRKGFDRTSFIGGSDARIIMGTTSPPFSASGERKRGEPEPQDLFEQPARPAGARD